MNTSFFDSICRTVSIFSGITISLITNSGLQAADGPGEIGGAKVINSAIETMIGDKVMDYDSALPVLTRMLDGPLQDRSRAIQSLTYYGTSLMGTEALKKLFAISEQKADFSPLEEKLKALRSGKFAGLKDIPFTPAENALTDMMAMKGGAVTAVVMSGASEGAALLQRYLQSPLEIERIMVKDAVKAREQFGSWTRGMIPTKPQARLFPIGNLGHSYPKEKYLALVQKGLASESTEEIASMVSTVFHGGIEAIKDTEVFSQLVKLFKETAKITPITVSIREMRLDILKIIGLGGDARAPAFLKEAAKDFDADNREMAESYLEMLTRPK